MADNYKPSALITVSADGEQDCLKVGSPDVTIPAFKDLRSAGGKGAYLAYVLTGRGIEYKAKFDVPAADPVPVKKSRAK